MRDNRLWINNTAVFFAALLWALVSISSGAHCDGLRIWSLADARIALEDRDNQINPYDFGRNPAWLLRDYDFSYLRLSASLVEISGDLRRDYDPHLTNTFLVGATGVKKLSDRQAIRGRIDYQRHRDREVSNNIEKDQYNDPFYLTDDTTGDIEYYGPNASVDWSIRLVEGLYFGAGFDYNVSTGLKKEYTKPEIVHNYFQGIFGLTWQPGERWVLGIDYRPTRLQNKTYFVKTDEGYDNLIRGYSGDSIFEVRSFSSYTITDILYSHGGSLHGFYMAEEFNAGLIARYGTKDNTVKYNASKQYEKGFWQEELIDLELRARYTPAGKGLVAGLTGRAVKNDGWGVRPDFDDVLLYDNPYMMYSAGLGLAYRITSIDLMLIGEYTAEQYDIEVWDNGANTYRKADHLSQIGRFALEKNISNIYSFRAGYEYTDYPVDRWIKLPRNIDVSRITGGIGAFVSGWTIDLHLEYGLGKQEEYDAERKGLGAVLWFTRYLN